MTCIIFSSLVTVTILIASMSFAGYFAFHETAEDLILLNLPVGSALSVLAKFAYLFTICGSTLMMFPVLFSYVEGKDSAPSEDESVAWYAFRRLSIVYLIFAAG